MLRTRETNLAPNRYKKLYSKITRSDVISIIGIFVSLFVGIAGCLVAYQISKQKQSINGFETLLTDNKTVIQNLNTELTILNTQLSLNEQAKNESIASSKKIEIANKRELYISNLFKLLIF